jgi:hypothetical protein
MQNHYRKFMTVGTNNALVIKEPRGGMQAWAQNEEWAGRIADALNKFEGKGRLIGEFAVIDDKFVIDKRTYNGDYDTTIAVARSKAAALRIAWALNRAEQGS